MDTKKIKEYCNNIIAIMSDYESTDQKGEINDLLIDLDLNITELNKEVNK